MISKMYNNMKKIYRNRSIFNQRGGSIAINNTTDQESIQLSQYSGSNILLNNMTNSELATNNKQTLVINDSFKTIGNDNLTFVANDNVERVGGTSYNLKGFIDDSQLKAFEEWKKTYEPIAISNSQFKMLRGGFSVPKNIITDKRGRPTRNPVLNSEVFVVDNVFRGYTKLPLRKSDSDEVAAYSNVPDHDDTNPARYVKINRHDVGKSAGVLGSDAPGVAESGSSSSASTENGVWEPNEDAININDKILEKQEELTAIELRMGDGGDEHSVIKRNKMETVGAVFNDYPSIRIDEKGRSQPLEMLVSNTGIFKNHDYAPLVEEIDNSSNFPCGQDSKIVGNSYIRTVGSGGISLKTTGTTELGGTLLKAGFKKINMNASHGVHIGSERGVEIQSLKTIVLRTNRQVFVESSMGVKNNLIVGGGLAVEGETYLQHITAPLEVQRTEDTMVTGKFATDEDRKLLIGECEIGGNYYPVYAVATDDVVAMYPHSHHFNNIPLTLMRSNGDVRKAAQVNNINKHNTISQSIPQIHEKKNPVIVNF